MKKIDLDQLREEKSLLASGQKSQKDKTTENYEWIKEIVREVITEEVDKLRIDVLAMKQTSKQTNQNVLQVISNQGQSKQREQSMLEGQEKSKSILQKLEKPAFFAALSATPLGDLLIDFTKEAAKKMVGEERFVACGDAVKAFLKPISGPILELISPLPFSLKIATAVVTLLVATLLLNHTVSVWTAIRSDLAKLRSLFASKK